MKHLRSIVTVIGRWGRLEWAQRGVSIIVLLAVWEVIGLNVSPLLLAAPSLVAKALYSMTMSGELLSALAVSIPGLLIGYVCAAVSGVLFGLLIGRSRIFGVMVGQYVNWLFVTPRISLLPMIVIWFGIGSEAQIILVYLACVFPIIINTATGVRNIDSALVETARVFGANERRIFFEVVIPASVPFIMSGLRLGSGFAVIGLIVAQMFLAVSGLGALLVNYGNFFKTANVLATVLVIGLVGVSFVNGVQLLENRFGRWKDTQRAFR